MTDTPALAERGIGAARIGRLDNELFDRLAAAHGAHLEYERAALVGIDRNTLLRYRRRVFSPSFAVASRMADILGTTIEKLFGAES